MENSTKILIFGMDRIDDSAPSVYKNNFSGIIVMNQNMVITSSKRLKFSGYEYNYLCGYFISFGGLTNFFVQNSDTNVRFFKMDENIGDLKQNVADVSEGRYGVISVVIEIKTLTIQNVDLTVTISDEVLETSLVLSVDKALRTYQKMYGGTVYYPPFKQYSIFQWAIDENRI
mmetsp:Transcript_39583/g.45451  ORF Transcript_39583/g.45451 Transcript_39583/m.45451 type:complete len:173 (+) Transcript_39583:3-521(+)